MRMKELEIDTQKMLKINTTELPKSCIIIFSEGKAKISELPSFAETRIITHQGQVKRIRWDEGEEF